MENQRVRLTKTMLKNALIELLGEKSLDKITVYELCATAQINRTTFYKYYGSQHDLLADIVNDLFDELEKNLLVAGETDFDKLRDVVSFLGQNRQRWRVLINAVDDRQFTERLFGLPVIRSLVGGNLSVSYSPRQEEYVRLYFCQGGYAIIRKWLNDDEADPPEEIAALITALSGGARAGAAGGQCEAGAPRETYLCEHTAAERA